MRRRKNTRRDRNVIAKTKRMKRGSVRKQELKEKKLAERSERKNSVLKRKELRDIRKISHRMQTIHFQDRKTTGIDLLILILAAGTAMILRSNTSMSFWEIIPKKLTMKMIIETWRISINHSTLMLMSISSLILSSRLTLTTMMMSGSNQKNHIAMVSAEINARSHVKSQNRSRNQLKSPLTTLLLMKRAQISLATIYPHLTQTIAANPASRPLQSLQALLPSHPTQFLL